MPVDDLDRNRPPGLRPVDLVPRSVVDRLVAKNQADLAALRSELASALREAELAEESVRRAHPASVVYDSDFAAEVLRYVAHSVGPSVPPPNPAPVSYSTVPSFGDVHRMLTDARAEPAPDVPLPPNGTNGAEPSGPHSGSGEEKGAADGTVGASVVDPARPPADGEERVPGMHRPRTTVVERSRPPDLETRPPSSWEQTTGQLPPEGVLPAEEPRRESSPRADDTASDHQNELSIGRGAASSARHWSKRVPSRLLIQLGLIIVIVGLIVLKLG